MKMQYSFKIIFFATFLCVAPNLLSSCNDTVSDISENTLGYEKTLVHLDEEDMRYVLAELQK